MRNSGEQDNIDLKVDALHKLTNKKGFELQLVRSPIHVVLVSRLWQLDHSSRRHGLAVRYTREQDSVNLRLMHLISFPKRKQAHDFLDMSRKSHACFLFEKLIECSNFKLTMSCPLEWLTANPCLLLLSPSCHHLLAKTTRYS